MQSASAALERTNAFLTRRHVEADERDRTADDRDRRADERDEAADERERVADAREVAADRRERLADERERLIDEQQRFVEEQGAPQDRKTEDGLLVSWAVSYRIAAAERAERMADQAESYAVYLEGSVARHGRDERLTIARREREIAAIERRNAAKLRASGAGPVRLERIPRLVE